MSENRGESAKSLNRYLLTYAMFCSMQFRSSSTLAGFEMKGRPPIMPPRSSVSCLDTRTEKNTTGMSFVSSWLRICCANSFPATPGMIISIRIKSGLSARAVSNPPGLFDSHHTSYLPVSSRTDCTDSSKSRSSSIIKILFFSRVAHLPR